MRIALEPLRAVVAEKEEMLWRRIGELEKNIQNHKLTKI